MKKNVGRILIIIFILSLFISTDSLAVAEEKYYMDKNVINTGKDNGYSGNNPIESNDVHFGWKLGRFFIKGYTQVKDEDTDNPIFLKNLGDKTQLWFNLEQEINKLNNNDRLSISEDIGAFDKHFGIAKQDFKKGALLIKKTNYQGFKEDPVTYFDFL